MRVLRDFYPKLHFWLWFNFGLYCVDMLFNYRAWKVLNARNKKNIGSCNLLLFFFYFGWGIYGLTLIYNGSNK